MWVRGLLSIRSKLYKKYTTAIADIDYVILSIAILLAQYHEVYAVDIIPEKVNMIYQHKSPIQDEYIEKNLAKKKLDLTAKLDAKLAYSNADFVVIADSTNVCPKFSVEFS